MVLLAVTLPSIFGNKRGQAQVTVEDNRGGAVSAALVTGTFTGDFNETLAVTTNSSVVATLTTAGQQKGSVKAFRRRNLQRRSAPTRFAVGHSIWRLPNRIPTSPARTASAECARI